jgi:hypothetical protein
MVKKIHARNRKIDAAVGAKTTYLSDEFKETINEVSGQNAAREVPFEGAQKVAVRNLHFERGDPDYDL